MIGKQHQRAAEQIRSPGFRRRPGRRDLTVDRRDIGTGAEDRSRCQPRDPRREQHAPLAGPVVGAGVGRASQRQNGDGTRDRRFVARRGDHRRHGRADDGNIVAGERIDPARSPEQRCHLLEAGFTRQSQGMNAAVNRPVLGDRPDRRIENRQSGVARPRRAWSVSTLLQGAHIVGAIAFAPRVRFGFRTDEPTADIGVERRRGDREFACRLPGRQEKRFAVYGAGHRNPLH